MPLGIYPTVDYVFKCLFGVPENADLLIHLLNAVLRPAAPIMEVTIENPFLDKDLEDDKYGVLDILATDAAGTKFNIEMQTTLPIDLPERLLFYGSRLLAGQLDEGEPYSKLRHVICICFLTRSFFRQLTVPHLRFVMAALDHHVELTDALQVHTIELNKYNWDVARLSQNTDLEKWSFFLRNAPNLEAEELRQLLPEGAFRKATGVLEMISQSKEQRLRHEARLKAQRDQASWEEYRQRIEEKSRLAEESVQLAEENAQRAQENAQRAQENAQRAQEQLKQGLINQIRVLEKVLARSPSDAAGLAHEDLAKLQDIVANLEAQLDQNRTP